MQLHGLGAGTAEAARLASLPWSTPRSDDLRDQLISNVHQRRTAQGVTDSALHHIGNPSPNIRSAALQRFNFAIADAQCEAASFAVAALGVSGDSL
eukprot:8862760-Lingulodinium_polyedra.AAC.1